MYFCSEEARKCHFDGACSVYRPFCKAKLIISPQQLFFPHCVCMHRSCLCPLTSNCLVSMATVSRAGRKAREQSNNADKWWGITKCYIIKPLNTHKDKPLKKKKIVLYYFKKYIFHLAFIIVCW